MHNFSINNIKKFAFSYYSYISGGIIKRYELYSYDSMHGESLVSILNKSFNKTPAPLGP